MAIYHLSAKVVSRGKGQSAVAAAAYRSGERLQDEQTGEQKFYEKRALRIVFTNIMAPKHAPEWAHDRNSLWNQAERAEKRKDAQLAREIEVSLPHELTEQQREWLVKDFARETFVRRGYAVDIAIHTPDRGGDLRNHHAHLMITMRVLGPDGFAPTKDRSLNSTEQLEAWRSQWADLANRHLKRHGHEARVDHRSLKAQGIDREATTHVGYAGNEIAARGAQSDRMDELNGVLERNGIRAELRATEEELAQLRELAANENRQRQQAPEPKRGTRTMLDGPTDDELKQQPKREGQYLAHMQREHERAKALLSERQRAQALDERAKAFQQAKEQEAEEGKKRQADKDAAESREGRNGDVSSASARYSIALGQNYDIRDPYASMAKAAGAESAAFHKNQEQLRAAAAKEADPDKRQAIDLRRKIEGCEYMAVTSDRLARISEAVTGRRDSAQAVIDRQQAVDWRAKAEALREERGALLEATQAKAAPAKEQQATATERMGQPAQAPATRRDPQPERGSPSPLPANDPAPKVAQPAPAQQPEPPRQSARLDPQPFAAVALKPYSVTMTNSAEPARAAPISPAAPFDAVRPSSSPAPARPVADRAPVSEPNRRFVEASAESHAAARSAGVSIRRVATPTTEATNSKGVTKTIEVTDRKAVAAGVKDSAVRKVTGIDHGPKHDGPEPGDGSRR